MLVWRRLSNEKLGNILLGLLEDTFGLKIYYARPYSPHERGSNEYHNGLLRQYFPKLSNFRKISQTMIDQAILKLNTWPRKTLKWKSPQHKFNLEYEKI